MVCEDILKQEADVVRIVYNRFVTAISYKPTVATILSAEVRARTCAEGYIAFRPPGGCLCRDAQLAHAL